MKTFQKSKNILTVSLKHSHLEEKKVMLVEIATVISVLNIREYLKYFEVLQTSREQNEKLFKGISHSPTYPSSS